MNIRSELIQVSVFVILTLLLMVEKAHASGHHEKHKKIIIHVPVHKKIERHTHTIVKHIHHHHKPIVVKEEKKIIEEHHHPVIKKEHVSHDHHHHHDAKHDHKHEHKHEHKNLAEKKPLEYEEVEEEHIHHHHNYEHKMHDDDATEHDDFYERH